MFRNIFIAMNSNDENEDLRGFFEKVLKKLKEGKDRREIIEETVNILEHL